MNNTLIYVFLYIVLCFVSCNDRTQLDVVYDAAGINGIELKKVIDHYSEKSEDSLKLKAATFIIENMPGHGSLQSEAGEAFRQAVLESLEKRLETDPMSVGSLVNLTDASAAPDVCVGYYICGEYNGCNDVSVCSRYEF